MGEASIIASEERRDHIRNQLSQVAISADELSILADCPVETVNAILVELEILGECERVAGGKIRAAST
jgi:predicted Rossmann fold nucleotide-binding protein DprA/Smf involved in DNA uptake